MSKYPSIICHGKRQLIAAGRNGVINQGEARVIKAFLKTHRSFCACFAAVAAVYLLCNILGWNFCAIQSGSMEPNIPTYSVCLVSTRVSYDDLKVGDVIVYERERDNERIVHRVTEITPDGIVTKGDANQRDDGISVTADNLYARYIGHVPYLGHFADLIRSRYGIFIILGAVCLLFVLDILDASRETKTPKQQ